MCGRTRRDPRRSRGPPVSPLVSGVDVDPALIDVRVNGQDESPAAAMKVFIIAGTTDNDPVKHDTTVKVDLHLEFHQERARSVVAGELIEYGQVEESVGLETRSSSRYGRDVTGGTQKTVVHGRAVRYERSPKSRHYDLDIARW